MRKLLAVAVVLVGGAAGRADDAPKAPAPQKEHEWLARFVGEWESEAEMVMAPGQPPVKSKGTESVRSLGGFWIASEMKGDCMGTPTLGQMTVGYDAAKKKYVGTWVCSMSDHLCQYTGTVDGNTLTLHCECPDWNTGKLVPMKDVVEFKDKDTRVLTSSMQGPDGKWVTFMTMTSKRDRKSVV